MGWAEIGEGRITGIQPADPPADPPADIKKIKRKLTAPCRKYAGISFRMKIWIRENKFLNRKNFLIRLWGYNNNMIIL